MTRATGRLLSHLVRLSVRFPVLTVLLSSLLAGSGLAYTIAALTFETSQRRLLPPGQRYAQRYAEYREEFGTLNDIVVVVEGRGPEEARVYADRLAEELKRDPARVPPVTSRIDPERFEGRRLLYLSVEELRRLREKLFDHREFLDGYAARPTLDRLIDGINRQIATAFVARFFDLGLDEDGPVNPRFLRDLLAQMSGRLDGPAPFRSPWSTVFTAGGVEEEAAGYFFSEDKRFLFIFVEPLSQRDSFTNNAEVIGAIRAAIARLREGFPGVRAGVTGAPALANDEMVTAFQDSQIALALALAATLGLLVVRFRRVGTPLLLLAALAASLAWSLGIVTLTVGRLNIFSVMFLPIVVGIGVDYGTYLFFRYEEELGPGRPAAEALARAAARTGPGILLGAATAAGTFYALAFTEFRGIQEFGFVSGTAILAAFAAMLTLFPALLGLADRRRACARDAGTMGAGLVVLLERLARRRAAVLGVAGLLTVASLWGVRGVEFDYNLLNLQASGTESVIWEEKLLAGAGRSGFMALSTARTLEELRRKREAFRELPSVSRVETILKLIPDRQPEKIGLIRKFAPLVEGVRFGEPGALDPGRFRTALRTLERRVDLAVTEAGPEASPEIRATLTEVRRLLRSLERTPPGAIRTALEPFQAEVHRDLVKKFRTLQRNLDPRPLGPDDAPPELRQKYVGRSGRFLLRIHPGVDIWSREGAERFVRELRSVDPDATGSAVINYEAIRLMEKGYSQGMLLAALLVAGLSILLLGRLREAMLALAPLGLATLWTVGLVYLFGLKLNLANVWGLPLVFGTAAEYGLNVVVRWMEARAHGGPVLARSTAMAVVLNGLTTIAGFGSLMVAAHRGIFSLGLLLTIGASASLIASLVVLPALINLFGQPAAIPVQAHATPAASRAPGDGRLGDGR